MASKETREPLTVNCFHCKREIIVKYVWSNNSYSNKNNWEYWTEDKVNKSRWFCDVCLIKIYRNYKYEFRKLITNKRKQNLLRQYINTGIVRGKLETEFMGTNNKEEKEKVNSLPIFSKRGSQKSIKEQILELERQIEELKKKKLLEVLQEFCIRKGIKRILLSSHSKYSSIYIAYLRWMKKYPEELPSLRKILD